jgi:hypothetical protein
MTSINISRRQPGAAAYPFWPAANTQLRLTIEGCDDKLIASGHDPDTNAAVFVAELRPDLQDAFVQAVRDAVLLVPNDAPPANDNVVVITGPGPEDPGPKFQYRLDLAPAGPPAP